ncbi:MAG: hypothetical protein ABIT01_06560 [Thermoanaerobaculia bacterium]
MQKVAELMRKYDHLLPWLLLFLIGGATIGVLQVCVMRLLK